jgi:chromosome segregation ATPase
MHLVRFRQVLQALLKGKIHKVDHDETPPMYSAREEVAPASELQREVDALRAERQLLLSRLDGHPAEVATAASAAAAEARAAAAAESERTVAGVEEAASRRLEEREAELTAELSEMEAEVSRVEEERQEVMRQLEEWKVEARAQQADLASCKRSLAEARKAADEAKVARVEVESQAGRRLKESNERHSNELATLRAHHEEEHRQGAKASDDSHSTRFHCFYYSICVLIATSLRPVLR